MRPPLAFQQARFTILAYFFLARISTSYFSKHSMPKEPESTFMERLADRRPPYFWWCLGFILAICFSVLSWSLCIAIFNHPEEPRNYEMLRTLNRLPIHKAYTSQTAPALPSTPPPVLRKSYLDFIDTEFKIVNRSLLRSYLTDFRYSTFGTYIKGDYRVTASRPLTDDDIISEGFAVRLRAYIQPDEYNKIAPYPLVAEIIFPTTEAETYRGFKVGDRVELGITPQFASLINVGTITQKDDDTIVRVSAISLAQKIKPPHGKAIELSPPREINLQGAFPLFPSH